MSSPSQSIIASVCEAVLKDPVFVPSITQLSSRKFRSRQDFTPIELMIGYMYFTNKGITLDAKPYTFYIEWTNEQTSMQKKFDILLNWPSQPNLICINDIPFETPTSGRSTATHSLRSGPSQRARQKPLPQPPVDLTWKIHSLTNFAFQYFLQAQEKAAAKQHERGQTMAADERHFAL